MKKIIMILLTLVLFIGLFSQTWSIGYKREMEYRDSFSDEMTASIPPYPIYHHTFPILVFKPYLYIEYDGATIEVPILSQKYNWNNDRDWISLNKEYQFYEKKLQVSAGIFTETDDARKEIKRGDIISVLDTVIIYKAYFNVPAEGNTIKVYDLEKNFKTNLDILLKEYKKEEYSYKNDIQGLYEPQPEWSW